ncbi:MAG: hypothetical protein J2P57_15200 [Acidimicrobiaceae bacterium]|nr:hypothetical protein [Acidimicrobiaceae bacterium]
MLVLAPIRLRWLLTLAGAVLIAAPSAIRLLRPYQRGPLHVDLARVRELRGEQNDTSSRRNPAARQGCSQSGSGRALPGLAGVGVCSDG